MYNDSTYKPNEEQRLNELMMMMMSSWVNSNKGSSPDIYYLTEEQSEQLDKLYNTGLNSNKKELT